MMAQPIKAHVEKALFNNTNVQNHYRSNKLAQQYNTNRTTGDQRINDVSSQRNSVNYIGSQKHPVNSAMQRAGEQILSSSISKRQVPLNQFDITKNQPVQPSVPMHKKGQQAGLLKDSLF